MYKLIRCKNLILREVEPSDSEFILSLRLDEKLNRYLSKTQPDVELQREYIKKYKTKNNEYYYIIESLDHKKLGTGRLYEISGDRFKVGSWLIANNAPVYTAIESILYLYDFAFTTLGMKHANFEVDKKNERVIAFHLRFGSKIVGDDGVSYHFEFQKEDFKKVKEKYKKYMT